MYRDASDLTPCPQRRHGHVTMARSRDTATAQFRVRSTAARDVTQLHRAYMHWPCRPPHPEAPASLEFYRVEQLVKPVGGIPQLRKAFRPNCRILYGHLCREQSYLLLLLLLVFHHPLSRSFIPDLKLSYCANPSHCSLSFSSSELTT